MATRVSVLGTPVMQAAPARRASTRLQLLSEVHGALVGLSVPIVLRDLSDGGFAIESVLQFPPQAQHLFELTLEDSEEQTIVKARAIHASPAGPGHPPGTVITGFAFSADQPHTTEAQIASIVSTARAMAARRVAPEDPTASGSGAERRTAPRLNVQGEMLGEVLSMGAPLLVRDFSEGGCSVETHLELPAGSEHAVRLELTDCLSVSIKARVVHCRRHAESGRPARYVSGLEFVDPLGQSQSAIAEMLGLLTTSPRR